MTANPATPVPVFTPWSGEQLGIRHHESHERAGQVAYIDLGPDHLEGPGWYLLWEAHLPPKRYDTALDAVAAARDTYPAYLQAWEDALLEDDPHWESKGQARQREAGAIARAVRVPMGGQKRPRRF